MKGSKNTNVRRISRKVKRDSLPTNRRSADPVTQCIFQRKRLLRWGYLTGGRAPDVFGYVLSRFLCSVDWWCTYGMKADQQCM